MRSRITVTLLASCALASRGSSDATRPIAQTLSLAPRSLALAIGAQVQFIVTTTPARPASALHWESSDTTSVRISSTGVALGVKSGVSLIRVWLVDTPTARDSAIVNVNQSGAQAGTIHP